MDYTSIYNLVNENNGKKFLITYLNGNKCVKRLFVSVQNNVCEFIPRSRTKGTILYIDNISMIKVQETDNNAIDCCRNNLKNVIKYLTASGLWEPMLSGANFFLTLDDETLLSMRTWDGYYKVMNDATQKQGIQWFGMDCFANLFTRKIKTANFHNYDRVLQKERLSQAIANKTGIRHNWRKGYDNSLEVRLDDDYLKGWYSEEYKGCGNGHYYFLLDNCHVLYAEDD